MPACGAKNCYVRSNRPLSQSILQPAPAAREQEGAESELAWLAIIFGSANAIRPMKPIIRIIGFARIIFTLNPCRHKHRSIDGSTSLRWATVFRLREAAGQCWPMHLLPLEVIHTPARFEHERVAESLALAARGFLQRKGARSTTAG